MKRFLTVLTLAAALTAAFTTTASAQLPITIGVHAGPAFPTGANTDDVNTGFTVGVELGFSPPVIPLGVRLDVDYTGFEESGTDINFVSGTVNGVFRIPMLVLRPYLIGGVGLFSHKVDGASRETDAGFQGGVGISFGLAGIAAGLEAKYVSVQAEHGSVRWIPITARLAFAR